MTRTTKRRQVISQGEALRAFVDQTVLLDAPLVPVVAVGPTVWDIDKQDGRRWYFVCASADAVGAFHLDSLRVDKDDKHLADRMRGAVFSELIRRPPAVIHDFEDEVQFAGFCAAMWPSERTRKILEEIKADYADRGHGP
jgi:hypothetical protein